MVKKVLPTKVYQLLYIFLFIIIFIIIKTYLFIHLQWY